MTRIAFLAMSVFSLLVSGLAVDAGFRAADPKSTGSDRSVAESPSTREGSAFPESEALNELSEEELTVITYYEAALEGNDEIIKQIVDVGYLDLLASEWNKSNSKKSDVADSPRMIGSELTGPMLLVDMPKTIYLGRIKVVSTERLAIKDTVSVVKAKISGKYKEFTYSPKYFSLHRSENEGWKIYDVTDFDNWGFNSKRK